MINTFSYLGINAASLDQWPTIASDFWGAHVVDPGPDGSVRIRFDGVPWRMQLHPAEEDSVAYLGWSVYSIEELEDVRKALDEMGVESEYGDEELAASRNVNKILVFTDPWGFRHEVIWGLSWLSNSFRPGRGISKFVTGVQGLGHVLLIVPDLEEADRFFSKLGFKLSDKILVPGQLSAYFYRCNARHHSLALGQGPPGVAGLQHLMIQVESMDDVGTAADMAEELGVKMYFTVGRHTNDEMFSFYHQTPSQFMVEYGYGGVEVKDDNLWLPRVYDRTAIWGHKLHPDAEGAAFALMHQLPEA